MSFISYKYIHYWPNYHTHTHKQLKSLQPLLLFQLKRNLHTGVQGSVWHVQHLVALPHEFGSALQLSRFQTSVRLTLPLWMCSAGKKTLGTMCLPTLLWISVPERKILTLLQPISLKSTATLKMEWIAWAILGYSPLSFDQGLLVSAIYYALLFDKYGRGYSRFKYIIWKLTSRAFFWEWNQVCRG